MRKTRKKTKLSFFDMNPFIMFCIVFAIMIGITAIFGILSDGPFYISARQLAESAILCAVPIAVLVMFERVPFLKYFNDEDCSPWISVPVHYVISSVLLLLITFAIDRFQSPISGYMDAIISYTQGYAIVVVLAVINETGKVSNVNKNLRKIQESQNKWRDFP